jgi:hypothetical protein
LKLPATSCGESPIIKEIVCFLFSLPPPQAAGNALAVQFIGEWMSLINQAATMISETAGKSFYNALNFGLETSSSSPYTLIMKIEGSSYVKN